MIHGLMSSYSRLSKGEFTRLETEELFRQRQKTQPADWEYNTKKIIYNYNQYGHRSVEIEELGDNYILATGCSITEGVALAYEDVWAHIVAKHIGCNFYNLAVGGSGPYVVCRNIIQFLSSKTLHKFPSAIVIQWPFFARFFRVHMGTHLEHLSPASVDSREYYDMLLKNNDAFYINIFERRNLLYFLMNIGYKGKIVEMFDQNTIELQEINTYPDHNIHLDQFIAPRNIDYARDLAHPGSKTHKLFANRILKFF